VTTKFSYRKHLDGLRAISVIAILLFHINPRILPGGYLGVDVFFIISGYLITSLLTVEYMSTEK
jgi:peptidoglycan/LPS O-acetylase OafA/YrhL